MVLEKILTQSHMLKLENSYLPIMWPLTLLFLLQEMLIMMNLPP